MQFRRHLQRALTRFLELTSQRLICLLSSKRLPDGGHMHGNCRPRTSWLFTVCLLGLAASSASAQTSPPVPPGSGPGVTFTPFMAMGDDYALGGGGSFSFRLASRLGLEAEASLGTDAARTGLSLLLDVARLGAFTTYAAAGAGVQRDYIDEELLRPSSSPRDAPSGGRRTSPRKPSSPSALAAGRSCRSDHDGVIAWTSAGQPESRMAGELAYLQRAGAAADRRALSAAVSLVGTPVDAAARQRHSLPRYRSGARC